MAILNAGRWGSEMNVISEARARFAIFLLRFLSVTSNPATIVSNWYCSCGEIPKVSFPALSLVVPYVRHS